jgi:hypothetical protein
MYEKSTINEHVRDLLEATDLTVKYGSGVARILVKETGALLGNGPNFASACVHALQNRDSAKYAQALFFAGALSFDPEALFEASNELWGDDDDDDGEEEEEEEEEPDNDSGSIHFHRE